MKKARNKKKRAALRKNKKRQATGKKEHSGDMESWVDNLSFVPVVEDEPSGDSAGDDHEEEAEESELPHDFSIISWNVLAMAYCSPRSHPFLPQHYQDVVFHKPRRRKRLLDLLQRHFCDTLRVDLICLQEVDLDEIGQLLRQLGYVGVETPRVSNGAGGRTDSSIIYARSETFEVLESKVLRMDDLATLSSSNGGENDKQQPPKQHETGAEELSKTAESTPKDLGANSNGNSNCNWQGLQHSFLRRNMAALVRLRHKRTGETLAVANAHLYWNPGYEYVKLCQAHYILQQVEQFAHSEDAVVFAGDLNSRPHGCTHSYLTAGHVNAKLMAPWYAYHHYGGDDDDNRKTEGGEADGSDEPKDEDVDGNNTHNDNQPQSLGPVRYLLDATLNKLCRWFRIMGIDAALETEQQEAKRTKEGQVELLFDRCREEKRTLITTSTRLMARRECPAGTYCIHPSYLSCLEVAMVHVLLTHGYALDVSQFLSRCVVCNGNILPVHESSEKCRILRQYDAPTDHVSEMEVYECNGCQQGYWWDDRPTSSASRVKSAATHLLVTCLRAGVPLKDEDDGNVDLGIFQESVNVKEERARGWDASQKGSDLLKQRLDVVEWLKQERLECPYSLQSVYGDGTTGGELIPFSNVTFHFVNTLDYIFFDVQSKLNLEARLHVPKSFPELNERELPNGHLLPSDVWPSDHLAIGGTFSFSGQRGGKNLWCRPTGIISSDPPLTMMIRRPHRIQVGPKPESNDKQESHDIRCSCGCVPAIPSLLEMAEQRKQLRQKQPPPNNVVLDESEGDY